MRSGKAALGATAVAAALVPFLAAQTGPVLHEEFARKLIEALDLEEGQPEPIPAPLAFSILAWGDSLAIPAERFLRAVGVEVAGPSGDREVVAREANAEVVYPVSVARRGDYRVRAELAGAQPVPGELRELEDDDASTRFSLAPPPVLDWVEAGATHLDPGVYAASLALPIGTRLGRLAIAPACLSPIEPHGGWKERAVLQTGELAVATLQAANEEDELPPADSPADMPASAFRITSPQARLASADAESGQLHAGPAGVSAQAVVDLAEAGRYTVSVFGIAGGGLSFLFDQCLKAVVCPPATPEAETKWHPLLTSEFTAGRHALTVNLGASAVVTKVRFEKKKDTPADYAATLRRLGFDPGPLDTAAARPKADEAARWVEARLKAEPERACGDIGAPAQLALAEPALPTTTTTPPFTGTPTGPLAPPAIPPQPPASPVTPLSSGGGS